MPPKIPPLAVPELPVVVTPPSSVYRVIRAATQTAVEDRGDAHVTRKNRPRWWAKRPRPTIQLALTEELYNALVAVATQEKLSLAAACRSLMTLGVGQYSKILGERVGQIVKENLAQRDR